MSAYTIGSLFSGYGGLDMGIQAALGPARVAWAPVLGRDFPDPKEDGRLSPAFAEWMMGLPAGHVTSPELGLSRAQQAAHAIRIMADRERAIEWGCTA